MFVSHVVDSHVRRHCQEHSCATKTKMAYSNVPPNQNLLKIIILFINNEKGVNQHQSHSLTKTKRKT